MSLIGSKTKNGMNDDIEIIKSKESNNKSPMESIPLDYSRYTGFFLHKLFRCIRSSQKAHNCHCC